MPRYHLDLQEDEHLYRDEDGRDFENDNAARRGAVSRLVDLLKDLPLEDQAMLVVIVVRRRGDREPFAAISTRITSLS